MKIFTDNRNNVREFFTDKKGKAGSIFLRGREEIGCHMVAWDLRIMGVKRRLTIKSQ